MACTHNERFGRVNKSKMYKGNIGNVMLFANDSNTVSLFSMLIISHY